MRWSRPRLSFKSHYDSLSWPTLGGLPWSHSSRPNLYLRHGDPQDITWSVAPSVGATTAAECAAALILAPRRLPMQGVADHAFCDQFVTVESL